MKKLNKLKTVVAFIILAVSLSSCSQRLMDFTVISSKNVSIRPIGDKAERVHGKSGTIKGAIDKAIDSAGNGADALIDGVVYYHEYDYVLFKWYFYTVDGTPINTNKLAK